MNEAERKILDMVEQGNLSAEEGLRLINAMGERDLTDDEAPSIEAISPPQPTNPQIPAEGMTLTERLKRWWVLPFGVVLLITTLGVIWMFLGYQTSDFGWGFWLAWLTFLLSIFILTVSYQTRQSV